MSSTYRTKWGCDRLQLRANALDLFAKTESNAGQVKWDSLVQALDTISRSCVRDSYGVSVLIVRAFVFGNPDAAIELFSNLLKDRTFMESFTIAGRVHGKESSTPSADKTRAILPLPALLVVADALIAVKLHSFITECCPAPSGVMFGARKVTQVLDITHAAQLHLQKGGDNLGVAGLAQGDIATYYDSLSCLRISSWLLSRGLDVF